MNKLDIEVEPPGKKAVTTAVTQDFHEIKSDITKEFQEASYVSTTADIWSRFGRSTMGVTGTYIDKNYNRQTRAIACRRFPGTHDNVAIARLISDIHQDIGLEVKKIPFTVTDSARNMKKAFATFSSKGIIDEEEEQEEEDEQAGGSQESIDSDNSEESGNSSDSSDSGDSYQGDEKDKVMVIKSSEKIFLALNNYDCQLPVELPDHSPCYSHLLNLIPSTELRKFLAQKTLPANTQHHKTFSKCTKLWNKYSRSSSKCREYFVETVGNACTTPCVVRWNSTFDSVVSLLEIERDVLNDACAKMNVPRFSANDFKYLQEYISCLSPIAITLDYLQGDDVFYGAILPWIRGVEIQLTTLRDSGTLQFCESLIELLIDSLHNRFGELFDLSCSWKSEKFVIASITHPKFKLRWLSEKERSPKKIKDIKAFVSNHLDDDEFNEVENSSPPPVKKKKTSAGNILDYMSSPKTSKRANVSSNSRQMEYINYLNDSRTDLKMLDDYPTIRRIFYKYNTASPSSAAVERLFSIARSILRFNRSRLSDNKFEQAVVSKTNKSMKKKSKKMNKKRSHND